jgi:chitodextrinase
MTEGQGAVPQALTLSTSKAHPVIGGGLAFSAAIRHNGIVTTWGKFYDGSKWATLTVPTALSTPMQAIAAGGNHVVVLRNDGFLAAWGRNDQGQANIPAEFKADALPPTVPSGLHVRNFRIVSGTFESGQELYSFDVRWNASTDVSGVKGYAVYRNGSYVTFTGSTTQSFSNISLNAEQVVTVVAVDQENNRSVASAPLSLTRESFRQFETPTVPTGLRAADIHGNGFRLQWNAATDNVAVRGYNVFRNGLYVASTSGTSYTFQHLTAGSTHQLSVQAWDDYKFRSARSPLFSITLPPVVPRPTQVRALTVLPTEVRLMWDAPLVSGGMTISGYNVYRNGLYVATVTSPGYSFKGLTSKTTYSFTVLSLDGQRIRSALTVPLSIATP